MMSQSALPTPAPAPEHDSVEMPWGRVELTFLSGKSKAAQNLVRGLEALDTRGGDVVDSTCRPKTKQLSA
jgi:hypothetical protein